MNTIPRIDFEGIARLALAQADHLLPRWFPAGRKHGREFKVGNLRGDHGQSLSINTETGVWKDYAAEVAGADFVNLYAAMHGLGQAEAARRLAAELGQPAPERIAPEQSAKVIHIRERQPPEWAAILPVPQDAPQPPATHPRYGTPAHVAAYRDAGGRLLGLIHRYEPPGQRKQIPSLTYCRNPTGHTEWRWQSLPKPRPLYGLDLLAAAPVRRVLLVEGEPKCEAARRLLGDAFVVVAWPGGASAVHQVDWSPLVGRDVVVWPDADGPGKTAADNVLIQVRHQNATARAVKPPDGVPEGWDLADAEREGWTGARVREHIDLPREASVFDPEDREPPQEQGSEPQQGQPFRILGHNKTVFYFLTRAGGQVIEFNGRDLSRDTVLMQLAPLSWWEMNYPGKQGANTKAAAGELVKAGYEAGIYDPGRLRGRGAWLDEGRTVLHLGDHLWTLDGTSSPAVFDSHHIYEAGPRLDLPIAAKPVSVERAKRLMDLCQAVSWQEPESMGRLLAGWLVIAPVCGAMPWRPHVYVTGEKGSGKTWVMDNLIRTVVGPVALRVASKTTEPGLRGALRLDARPVLFDEFESQNEADRIRVQQVLDLARQASSEDNAEIVKGAEGGRGVNRYRIRSCFAFSSINVGLSQAADESRTVVLTVMPPIDPKTQREAFDKLKALHAEVLTPDFAAGLLARTLRLLPVIRENAEVFAQAIARSGKPRRTGDTVGVLLAGAWSLRSGKLATTEEADKFVRELWVQSAIGQADDVPEWQRALSYLVQQRLRVVRGNGRPDDIPIGELIALVAGRGDASTDIPLIDARVALTRAGVRVEADEESKHLMVVRIANTSDAIRKFFEGTSWATAWLGTFARAPGARRTDKAFKFAGHTSKALELPIVTVVEEA